MMKLLQVPCMALIASSSIAHAQPGSDAMCPELFAARLDKPLRIVVPFPPGGTLDHVTRLVASGLETRFAQPVVVENLPGAGGLTGAQRVSQAEPDGYTVLASYSFTVGTAAYLRKQDLQRQLDPISFMAQERWVLVTSPSSPFKSPAELRRYGRENPGKAAVGSSGTGSYGHILAEVYQSETGAKFVHVPYRGMGPAFQDLLSGHIAILFAPVQSALAHIKAGKARPILVAAASRDPDLPEVPTARDAGVGGLDTPNVLALWGPRGIPTEPRCRVYQQTRAVLQSSTTEARLRKLSVEPLLGGPARVQALVQQQADIWTKVMRQTGIRPD